MRCDKCKKQHVCFILRTFVEAKEKTYPWWEPSQDAIAEFVYSHCTQADLSDS